MFISNSKFCRLECVKVNSLVFYLFLSRKLLPNGYVSRYFPDSQVLCRRAEMQPLKRCLTLNTVGR
jgi:hypothetical protein